MKALPQSVCYGEKKTLCVFLFVSVIARLHLCLSVCVIIRIPFHIKVIAAGFAELTLQR